MFPQHRIWRVNFRVSNGLNDFIKKSTRQTNLIDLQFLTIKKKTQIYVCTVRILL